MPKLGHEERLGEDVMDVHRIQVEQCEEGTHILCTCGALFEEQGLPALLVFLETHSR